jgi:hypothetical protein
MNSMMFGAAAVLIGMALHAFKARRSRSQTTCSKLADKAAGEEKNSRMNLCNQRKTTISAAKNICLKHWTSDFADEKVKTAEETTTNTFQC